MHEPSGVIEGLGVIAFQSGTDPQPGELVFAIGSPEGLQNSGPLAKRGAYFIQPHFRYFLSPAAQAVSLTRRCSAPSSSSISDFLRM